MLVLNRKAGQSLTIDGNIKIKILSDFGVVRLGIEAPKHIKIIRDELLEGKYHRSNKNIRKDRTNKKPHNSQTITFLYGT